MVFPTSLQYQTLDTTETALLLLPVIRGIKVWAKLFVEVFCNVSLHCVGWCAAKCVIAVVAIRWYADR